MGDFSPAATKRPSQRPLPEKRCHVRAMTTSVHPDFSTTAPMTDRAYESGASAFVEVMRRRHLDAAVVRASDVQLAPLNGDALLERKVAARAALGLAEPHLTHVAGEDDSQLGRSERVPELEHVAA